MVKTISYLKCGDPKYPYLCPEGTLNVGLCVSDEKACNQKINRNKNMIPKIPKKDLVGKKYAYEEYNLHCDCEGVQPLTEKKYKNFSKIPEKIKIMTWNIWGLQVTKSEFHQWCLSLRMQKVIENIKLHNPDIICLQEVSTEIFEILKSKFGNTYNFYDEDLKIEKTEYLTNRCLEILFLSKIPAKKYTNYILKGNLTYSNALSILEFPEVVIFGCYLQAGSRFSPGQQWKWWHYSRCRSEQLRLIQNMYQKYNKKKIILLGDFNTHLDGPMIQWPELSEINKILKDGFVDSYRYVYPEIKNYPGYTEDTQTNHMRYNIKFMEKHVRYDAIIVKNMTPVSSKIIGTEPIYLNDDEAEKVNLELFGKEELRTLNGKLALWASDHYGLLTILGPNP